MKLEERRLLPASPECAKSTAQNLILLCGGKAGPWIKTKGLRQCNLRIRGLVNSTVVLEFGLADKAFSKDGDYPIESSLWMRARIRGDDQNVIVSLLGSS